MLQNCHVNYVPNYILETDQTVLYAVIKQQLSTSEPENYHQQDILTWLQIRHILHNDFEANHKDMLSDPTLCPH